MANEHIRWPDIPPIELGAQLVHDAGGVPRSIGGVAAKITRPSIGNGTGAVIGDQGLDVLPDIEGISQSRLQYDRARDRYPRCVSDGGTLPLP